MNRMKITESIFKAYDIRGISGEELTNELAEAVGRGLADYLTQAGSVAVGYDMRPDSFELAKNVRAGLIKQGRDVIDIGCVASDMIYYAVGSLGTAGGAMVTASHNPGKYNGIKLCGENARGISLDAGLSEIRDNIKNDSFKENSQAGTITKQNVMDGWVTHALSFVDVSKLKPYHIAVDAGNGMGGAVMPYIEGKWPITVEPMFFELDGTFPNHLANPLVDENNRFLVAKIKEDNLDFGVAFDGDGDRAFLIDENGKTVSGSIMTAILADYFLKKEPGASILYNVNCSRVVAETIAAAGGKGYRTKVGHSFIKQDMRKYDGLFAGEHSGHYFFRDNWNADSGLIAAICAIAALSDSGLKLSELASKYDKYSASGEINFEVADKEAKIAELKAAYADGEVDELDGLMVNYPDWWFIVRPSNTEPLLRLNVEATTPAMLEENLAKLKTILSA
jgi:phosphomannomutase